MRGECPKTWRYVQYSRPINTTRSYWRLLLDSGVVDVTMSYNAICTSRIILEGIVFQEPYKRVEPSKRPCEHKTLESNKSHSRYRLPRPSKHSPVGQNPPGARASF